MFTAINKQTQRLVHAAAIYADSSYIKPKDDIWLVNPDQIENYEEVLEKNNLKHIECRYKKAFERNYINKEGASDICDVSPHFYIPNQKELGVSYISESLTHKKIKEFIFNEIINNKDFKFIYSTYKSKSEGDIHNYIFFKDLIEKIDWQRYNTSNDADFFEANIVDIHNTRRVDVLIPFKKKDILLGEGLAIEVQLSKQSLSDTKKRTIDRALKGYSVCWIDELYFEDTKAPHLKLINVPTLLTWQSVLHNNSDIIADTIYNKIQKFSRQFDEKIQEAKKQIQLESVSGTYCPNCKMEKKLGVITKTKDGRGLYCTNRANIPKCDFWVNL